MELVLVLIFVIAPISLLSHELGHAIVAYQLRAHHISLQLGVGPLIYQKKGTTTDIMIRLLYFVGAMAIYERNRPFSRKEQAFISLGGPLANGILAFLCICLVYWVEMDGLYLFSGFNLWIAIINLLPFKWKERESDGYVVVKALYYLFVRPRG
ncbi:M50 family metallopeptidase [Pontibacillus litoralis]|uniref:Peptidase M50 domain-containing protein n=1 Tax=Pontibacillus litoralis JSM 072002 TaxID=1385512 RepID=A0A0A5FYW7_9BACI|nr:M50 family metallopeptidase [Pontibacillus litoralis]KGX86016.1 hypothetical protein N784_06250 [Pontibacillus litoralis JSM 072002]